MERESTWRDLLLRAGVTAEHSIDSFKYRLKRRLGLVEPVTVHAYRAYGTTRRAFVFARVLEDEGGSPATPDDTPWENIMRMYRRLDSDEIPDARVRVRFAGVERVLSVDEEGYISVEIDAADSPGGRFAPGQHEILYDVIEPSEVATSGMPVRGEVYIPRPESQFVVISDIDDTIMHTEATSFLRLAINSVFGNAHTRVAFPGVSAFYKALHRKDGVDEGGLNPFFYLTSSMWNVYDLIRVFFELQEIPAGPILMRDLGLSRTQFFKSSHDTHKLARIRHLLDLYPEQTFILVGDTGQRDAEIYREICRQTPHRVLAVYLRNVRGEAREEEVNGIVTEIRGLGVGCVASRDTIAHAEHAAEHGWVTQADVERVRAASHADEAADAQDDPGGPKA